MADKEKTQVLVTAERAEVSEIISLHSQAALSTMCGIFNVRVLCCGFHSATTACAEPTPREYHRLFVFCTLQVAAEIFFFTFSSNHHVL